MDVAIFSLSLIGANFTDYLREAHRLLRLDGQLHIYEATTRFNDREQFARDLAALGFDGGRWIHRGFSRSVGRDCELPSALSGH